MSTFDYVDIPPDVIRLQSPPPSNPVRPFTKICTSLPSQSPSPNVLPSTTSTFNPTKSLSTLLSTSLPTSIPTSSSPRKSSTALLSSRDPLSIPITTVNFRRFVARVGPVFWLQDRVEEVLMWRRGWKVTAVWISAYAFLCYFPRIVLLLPHAMLATIMLSTYPAPLSSESISSKSTPTPIAPPPSEGSVDWQVNLQAIQNLMGALSDAYDLVLPITPYLTHRSTYTPLLLMFTLLSSLIFLPVLPLIPLRPLFFVLGVSLFAWTHPFTQARIIPLLNGGAVNRGMITGGNAVTTLTGLTYAKYTSLKMKLQRWIDDDRLEDRHLNTEMREVELWENERWTPGPSSSSLQGSAQDDLDNAGANLSSGSGMDDTRSAFTGTGTWNKLHLRPADRAPWTRGRDGWSGVGGEVSNLTFSLSPGWAFVETEGWRSDAVGSWVCTGNDLVVCRSDENGWVYTNDVWADPRPAPLEAWRSSGMTRRRRWIRRVYFDPALVVGV